MLRVTKPVSLSRLIGDYALKSPSSLIYLSVALVIDMDKELAPNGISLTFQDLQQIVATLYCVGKVEVSPATIDNLLLTSQVLGIPSLIQFLKRFKETSYSSSLPRPANPPPLNAGPMAGPSSDPQPSTSFNNPSMMDPQMVKRNYSNFPSSVPAPNHSMNQMGSFQIGNQPSPTSSRPHAPGPSASPAAHPPLAPQEGHMTSSSKQEQLFRNCTPGSRSQSRGTLASLGSFNLQPLPSPSSALNNPRETVDIHPPGSSSRVMSSVLDVFEHSFLNNLQPTHIDDLENTLTPFLGNNPTPSNAMVEQPRQAPQAHDPAHSNDPMLMGQSLSQQMSSMGTMANPEPMSHEPQVGHSASNDEPIPSTSKQCGIRMLSQSEMKSKRQEQNSFNDMLNSPDQRSRGFDPIPGPSSQLHAPVVIRPDSPPRPMDQAETESNPNLMSPRERMVRSRASDRDHSNHAEPLASPTSDSNQDGLFDSSDLVVTFQRGEYDDSLSLNSTFQQVPSMTGRDVSAVIMGRCKMGYCRHLICWVRVTTINEFITLLVSIHSLCQLLPKQYIFEESAVCILQGFVLLVQICYTWFLLPYVDS